MLQADLRALALRWRDADPDPITRQATNRLVKAPDESELQIAFGKRLGFGTAGIRGSLGPGPGHMNRALIRQVTAGLAQYLTKTVGEDALVVVGRDQRHGSEAFARDTIAVLVGLGHRVRFYEDIVPTPVLAHAVKALGAAAGVMVTASHNPREDNGYKVYWGNGAQIVPPHDVGIAAEIDAVGGPWNVQPPPIEPSDPRVAPVPDDIDAAYLRGVLALRVHHETGAKAVYTAMHGVGWQWMQRVALAAGHLALEPVTEQVEPDGDFPTVQFPNPEEPGALDLARQKADAVGADVIIANDPDADRLAVAVPDGAGGWRKLTGNEVGVLLADDLLAHGEPHPRRLVATTIVSTSLLQRVAALQQAHIVETLTGFKWIANAALDWDGPFVLGFEEALGYTAGEVVRDKDGVSAALLILDMASWCKRRGVSLLEQLTDLYRRTGYALSRQTALHVPGDDGKARITTIMDALRAAPPAEVAGNRVLAIRDVRAGTRRDVVSGDITALDLPTSNVLAFDLENGARVLARPSGTEPKLKFYFEVTAALGATEPLAAAEARAATRMDALQADFLRQAGVEP
jgi:phosphomannomutase